MKKTVSLVLAAVLLLTCGASLASGKLSVDTENFIIPGGWLDYGYCFAKVSNVGDKPIKVNAGVFEIYDDNGEALSSSDYLYAYPDILQPGEYCYTTIHADLEESQLAVASDYMLTITGKSENDKVITRLPVECTYVPNATEGWWTRNILSATVTNNTDQTLFDIRIVMALLDADGKVLYVNSSTCYQGLTAGSTIVFDDDVSTTYLDYYAAKGVEIAGWDAIAYVELDA